MTAGEHPTLWYSSGRDDMAGAQGQGGSEGKMGGNATEQHHQTHREGRGACDKKQRRGKFIPENKGENPKPKEKLRSGEGKGRAEI